MEILGLAFVAHGHAHHGWYRMANNRPRTLCNVSRQPYNGNVQRNIAWVSWEKLAAQGNQDMTIDCSRCRNVLSRT